VNEVFKPNDDFDRSLLREDKEVWIVLSSNSLEISLVPFDAYHVSKNQCLASTFSCGGQLSAKITYFYGFGGYGTLIMNTWITFAKQLHFYDASSIKVSGTFDHDKDKHEHLINFYEKFGFNIFCDTYGHKKFSATLNSLRPVVHSETRSDYLFKTNMFSNKENGELLSERYSSICML